MSSEYPNFIHNNERLIIKPGKEFTTNELKIRLKTMGIDANNMQSKLALEKLYDLTIKTDENKLKIFHKLKHDTEINTFNKLKKKQKNMDLLPVNDIPTNKQVNLQNNMYINNNRKVQIKRANKITEESINNIETNPLLINSENIRKDEYKLRKILKQILCHSILGFFIISISLVIVYIYRIYSEEVNKYVSRFFAFVSNYDIYWFILAFILIFVFLYSISIFAERFLIKKRCRDIIKKMKRNNEENIEEFSDEEIYRKYGQNYGVNYNIFIKKYIPILKRK